MPEEHISLLEGELDVYSNSQDLISIGKEYIMWQPWPSSTGEEEYGRPRIFEPLVRHDRSAQGRHDSPTPIS